MPASVRSRPVLDRRANPSPQPSAAPTSVPPFVGEGERLLTKPEVCEKVGASFVSIWTWMRQGRFPRSRDRLGRPVWLASEIDAWIASLPVKPLKGDADHAL